MSRFGLWRSALRSLWRRPGFSIIAVGTVALALGATTGMFSIVHGALLRPLPFREPDRLELLKVRAHTGFFISISMPNYRDWRDRSRSFASMAGITGWNVKLTGRGPAEIVNSAGVHGDLFGTLGFGLALGRGFSPDETPDHPGGAQVVVLGNRYWRSRFGGDPALVGQTLTLGGRPYTVIGILDAGTGFPDPEVDLYFPLATLPADDVPWDDRNSGFGTDAVARLRPGVGIEEARNDLARVNREVAGLVGPKASSVEAISLDEYYLGSGRSQLWILLGAVGFVLLIVIANVGNLLLVRGEERHRELAVRAALGAGQGRLVRLLLAEAMVIAIAGGVLGTAIAFAIVRLVVPFLPADIPTIVRNQVGIDGTVLLAGVAIALLTGLLFGFLPSLRSARVNLTDSMRGVRTTDRSGGPIRAVLVTAEVALALVLMAGAGLTIKSLDRLLHVDKGFEARNVFTAAISPSSDKLVNAEEWRSYYGEARRRMAALPGVRSAAITLLVPLSHRSWELSVHPEGEPIDPATEQSVLFNLVSPEYFETMGVALVRGRGFTASDRDGAVPVAVVDESLAQRFWPGEDPIGKRITLEETAGRTPVPVYRTIVGVVRNVRHYELQRPARIEVYLPLDQSGRRWGMSMRVAVRTDGDPGRLEAPLRRILAEQDAGASLYLVGTLEEYLDRASSGARALSRVLGAFGAAALGLAGLGIFGVVSYTVRRRTRDIGIRMALGARSGQVLRWVGTASATPILAGLGLGVLGALAVSRVLRKSLFEVSPLDPAVYALTALGVLAAALAAVWLPARRASRVDPALIIRQSE